MGFLRHIRACGAHDISRFRPFFIGTDRVGWVRHELAERLRQLGDIFVVGEHRLTLVPGLETFNERSQALAEAVEWLVKEEAISQKLRGEFYPVLARWATAPLARIDRAAVPYFGFAAYGLHVNGFVRRADGLHLWVARRARDRLVEPGKLDNLIAGGQPIGLTLAQNLTKEAQEEAGFGPEIISRAVPVGVVTYTLETAPGVKPDTMFLYDLELRDGEVPANTDGEVESFELWPIDRVAASVRDTDDWKFNCNLVVIDFLVRHGWMRPDTPDYVDILKGLRQ